ncbi:MAG: hypothetical protein HQK97_04470 [Nitrospirae bacterium]|nr:hypothetical protein [Nitrospirota bacterium]
MANVAIALIAAISLLVSYFAADYAKKMYELQIESNRPYLELGEAKLEDINKSPIFMLSFEFKNLGKRPAYGLTEEILVIDKKFMINERKSHSFSSDFGPDQKYRSIIDIEFISGNIDNIFIIFLLKYRDKFYRNKTCKQIFYLKWDNETMLKPTMGFYHMMAEEQQKIMKMNNIRHLIEEYSQDKCL